VFPVRTGVVWGGDAPGMTTLRDISKISDPSGRDYRPVHYIAGVCSALYMKEAMDWADTNGGVNGPNVRNGFYARKDWVPAGMEGVCLPSTWTENDHRGMLTINLYRSKVSGSTEAPLADLIKNGTIKLEKVTTINLPRKPEWLGW
jgi:branched-chain amino acid transport system substrate-binding protein